MAKVKAKTDYLEVAKGEMIRDLENDLRICRLVLKHIAEDDMPIGDAKKYAKQALKRQAMKIRDAKVRKVSTEPGFCNRCCFWLEWMENTKKNG